MSSVQAKPLRNTHLDVIDMLRGLAALGVVCFHVRVDLWVGWKELHAGGSTFTAFDRLLSWLSVPAIFGGSGVMLFFLISGFCVHLPFVGQTQGGDLKAYAARRFLRIYPPYLAAVILTIIAEWISHDLLARDAQSGSTLIMRAALMIQNFGDSAGQLSGNPSLWSLPVEMELYVAYVVLQIAAIKYGWNRILMLVALATGISFFTEIPFLRPASLHFLNFWPIWCGGCLLAEWSGRQTIPRLGVISVIIAVTSLLAGMWAKVKNWPVSVEHYLFAIFYFHVIWGLLRIPESSNRLPAPLRNGLVHLGVISYSLYLIHFPLFRVAGAGWENLAGGKPVNFFIPIFFVGISILVAVVFHRCVEKPAHELARNLGRRWGKVKAEQRSLGSV